MAASAFYSTSRNTSTACAFSEHEARRLTSRCCRLFDRLDFSSSLETEEKPKRSEYIHAKQHTHLLSNECCGGVSMATPSDCDRNYSLGRFQNNQAFHDWTLMRLGNLRARIFRCPVEIGSPKMHFDAKCEHAASLAVCLRLIKHDVARHFRPGHCPRIISILE